MKRLDSDMPRGIRPSPPVVVGILCLALLAFAAVQREWVFAAPERMGFQESERSTESHTEQELSIQRNMAFWAMLTFWSSVAAVGVAAVGVKFVAKTLEQTSAQTAAAVRQANLAHKQFMQSKKPILRVVVEANTISEALDVDGEFPDDAITATVTLKLANLSKERAAFFPEECLIELSVRSSPPIPEERNFRHFHLHDLPDLVHGADTVTIVAAAAAPYRIDQASDIESSVDRLFLFALFRYRDENGFDWEFGYCAECTRFGAGLWGFEPFRGEPYSFDRARVVATD